MPAREAWGLDIGQTAIHAVRMKRLKGGACEIDDLYLHPLDTRLDDPDYDDKVVAALQEFVTEKKVGKTPVVVSLPGFTTLFREFTLPSVSSSRMDEIVSFEARQHIPYPLEDVVWDYHQLRVDEDTGETGIALLCCRRDIVEGILGILDDVKLNIDALQVGPVALVNYIQYETPPETPALILDTGARGTDFVVLNDGAFWLRSIGVSGTDLTKVLMSKFSIPYDKAEELKRQVGDSKQGDRVFRVMEPVLRNLCGEVQRSVGYYKSLFRGVKIDEIICAGNTYMLSGVDQFLADHTGLPARTLTVPAAIGTSFTVDEGELEEMRQVMGTAAGLALQGLGLAEVKTNLLPAERRLQRAIRGKLNYAGGAAAAVALAVGLNLLTAGGASGKYDEQVAASRKVTSSVSSAQNRLKEIMNQYPALTAENQALAGVAPTRGYLLEAFHVAMSPIERFNRTAERDNLTEREVASRMPILLPEYRRLLQMEVPPPEWTEQELEYWPKLTELLEERVRQRLSWQYASQGRVFIEDMKGDVVSVVQAKEMATGRVWWELDKPPAPATTGGYGMTGGNELVAPMRSKPVNAVEVRIKGYMVTDSRPKALEIKNAFAGIDGVLEFKAADFSLKSTETATTRVGVAGNQTASQKVLFTPQTAKRSVRVPAVTQPQLIIKESPAAAAAGTTATTPVRRGFAPMAPAQPTPLMRTPTTRTAAAGTSVGGFEAADLDVIEFDLAFYYLPTRAVKAFAAAAASGTEE